MGILLFGIPFECTLTKQKSSRKIPRQRHQKGKKVKSCLHCSQQGPIGFHTTYLQWLGVWSWNRHFLKLTSWSFLCLWNDPVWVSNLRDKTCWSKPYYCEQCWQTTLCFMLLYLFCFLFFSFASWTNVLVFPPFKFDCKGHIYTCNHQIVKAFLNIWNWLSFNSLLFSLSLISSLGL